MKPNAMQAERERARAGHLTQKFGAIGPAAILAALVCACRKDAQDRKPADADQQQRPAKAA